MGGGVRPQRYNIKMVRVNSMRSIYIIVLGSYFRERIYLWRPFGAGHSHAYRSYSAYVLLTPTCESRDSSQHAHGPVLRVGVPPGGSRYKGSARL